jgi:hypothetical protein
MSQLGSKPSDGGRGVIVEKPPANVYTVLLILSLVAVLVGCLSLYLEMSAYNFEITAK